MKRAMAEGDICLRSVTKSANLDQSAAPSRLVFFDLITECMLRGAEGKGNICISSALTHQLQRSLPGLAKGKGDCVR